MGDGSPAYTPRCVARRRVRCMLFLLVAVPNSRSASLRRERCYALGTATSRNELLAMSTAPTSPYLHPALLNLLKHPGELCGVEGGA